MSKRNAIRLGINPNAADSVAFTVRRYGIIEPKTLAEIIAWLEKNKDEYSYEIKNETISDEGEMFTFPIIKTIRKGSMIYKILDNQHDALNTLENIRNKDFPKNKQGN